MDQDMQNEVATGAPGTLPLGGKVWIVSQPSAQHFSMLRQWARKRLKKPLASVAREVEGLPIELQQAAIEAAVKLNESGSELTADRIQDELTTVEGCGWWLWVLTREHHPDATPATFRALMDEDTVHGVLADLRKATRLEDVDPNANGGSGAPHSPTSLP